METFLEAPRYANDTKGSYLHVMNLLASVVHGVGNLVLHPLGFCLVTSWPGIGFIVERFGTRVGTGVPGGHRPRDPSAFGGGGGGAIALSPGRVWRAIADLSGTVLAGRGRFYAGPLVAHWVLNVGTAILDYLRLASKFLNPRSSAAVKGAAIGLIFLQSHGRLDGLGVESSILFDTLVDGNSGMDDSGLDHLALKNRLNNFVDMVVSGFFGNNTTVLSGLDSWKNSTAVLELLPLAF